MIAKPKFMPPLDPGFQPAVLWERQYLAEAKAAGDVVPLVIGLERENGLLSRFETIVRPTADADTLRYVERTVKFLLWAWGGWKLHFGGPKVIGQQIAKIYSLKGARKFDCEMMARAYGKKFQVVLTTPAKVPKTKEMQIAAGGHLKGCRIGFDLGASDYKVSAVVDGEAIFTEEQPWDPKTQALIGSIADFEVLIVKSEPEALLLEGKLIKEYKPRYNAMFKDDKRFLMVKVSLNEEYPRF